MKISTILSAFFILVLVTLTSCDYDRIGPYEEDDRTYGLTNFDRLDIGSAFNIKVEQGSAFRVEARGNRNDLDDLEIYTSNGTLHAQFRRNRSRRRYDLYINITMPTLRGVEFSGASRSTIDGFQGLRELDITLTGASKSTVDVAADRLNFDLSGASDLDISGGTGLLRGELSGASSLYAFEFPVDEAELDLSGASSARVRVAKRLDVTASGASNVRYRGTPELRSRLSGSSSVTKD
ncbi:head GIN domain-containing protein [Larkinella soli]|uniref:head GIN domain-containing protein n=1 Tax=Larkinella soli TaxID=1770527 RepID=UPI000FFCA0C3|nr:head GIN domain-containing protein [Larkinella soli]